MKRIILFFAITLMALGGTHVFAVDPNIWRQDQTFEVMASPYAGPEQEPKGCTDTIIPVFDKAVPVSINGCVYRIGDISIATYNTSSFGYFPDTRYAIYMPNDLAYRNIDGLRPAHTELKYIEATKQLLIRNTAYDPTGSVPDYELFKTPMTAFQVGAAGNYEYNNSSSVKLFNRRDPDGNTYAAVNSFAISKNGKYAAALTDNSFVSFVNLETGEEKIIKRIYNFTYSSPAPVAGAISDDGRYIYVGNLHNVYFVESDCGQAFSFEAYANFTYENGCGYTSLTRHVAEAVPYTYLSSFIRFDDNDTTIKFNTLKLFTSEVVKHSVVIKSEAFKDTSAKKYIALGDSYSSGEGDVSADGSSYYIDQTDFVGGCHLSSRSYPFIISSRIGLSTQSMGSVACSGARLIYDINPKFPEKYLGQNDRLASLMSPQLVDRAKNDALTTFMPGYAPQIDFVKKYKPAFVTITAGGNDVGFADILLYCAQKIATCGFAKQNDNLNALAKTFIEAQETRMRDFLRKAKVESPNTVVYVLGYPQFVVPKTVCKISNVGFLSEKELTYIEQSVRALNEQIRSGAASAGAYYVDVENALAGGRLCEQDHKYMTGIDDLPGLLPMNGEYGQAFHPNAAGHVKIADAFLKQYPNVSSQTKNPEPTAQKDNNASLDSTVNRALTVKSNLKNHTLAVSAPSGTFNENVKIEFVLSSNEITFKEHAKSNDDGSLSVTTLTLPKSIEQGLHVLIAKPKDYTTKNKKQAFEFVVIGDLNIQRYPGRCDSHSHDYEKSKCERSGKD